MPGPPPPADPNDGRTADDLRRELAALAARIDPFPPFPGAMFAYGIEIDPPEGYAADVGCVVLGNDGQLYELQLGLDPDRLALDADHVATRHEQLVPLDLPAAHYAAYARRAIEVARAWVEGAR